MEEKENYKTTEAQRKAARKWNAKNTDSRKKSRHKSSCKAYIRDWANLEDLEEVENWITERKIKLEKDN